MDSIARNLLAMYAVAADASISLIRETEYNAVYKIRDNGKAYVLRISKQLPREDLAFEIETLRFLTVNHFPAPEVFFTSSGKPYSENGEFLGTLFSYIHGMHVQVDTDHLPSLAQTEQAGVMLGRMHQLTQGYAPVATRSRTIFSELERAIASRDLLDARYEDASEFLGAVTAMLLFGKKSQRFCGLVHNDFRSHNVFFVNTDISGVIDFDWSCTGPMIKDVAHGALEWSFPDGRDEPDFKILQVFLDGYNQTAPEKINLDTEFYQWIMFAALADTSTYLLDRMAPEPDEKARIRSYMYKKFRYFRNLVES